MEFVQIDHLQQLFCASRRGDRVKLSNLTLEHDVCECGAPIQQYVLLKDDADVGVRAADLPRTDVNGSARWGVEAGHKHHQRAFAAAAWPDDGNEFSLLNIQVDGGQGLNGTVAGFKRLRNTPNCDRAVRAVGGRSRSREGFRLLSSETVPDHLKHRLLSGNTPTLRFVPLNDCVLFPYNLRATPIGFRRRPIVWIYCCHAG